MRLLPILLLMLFISACQTTQPSLQITSLNLDQSFDYHHPKWSPDGYRLAFARSKDRIYDYWLYSFETGQLTQFSSEITGYSWSPDGKYLVYSSNGDLWKYEVASNSQTNLTADFPVPVSIPLWSPNGKLIAFISSDEGDYWVIEPNGENPVNLTPNVDIVSFSIFSWSHNSAQLVIVNVATQTITTIDLNGNITSIYNDMSAIPAISSPINDDIAFASSPTLEIFDIYLLRPSSEVINLTNTPDLSEGAPIWSPDGRYIAYQATTSIDLPADLGIIDTRNSVHEEITNTLECSVGFVPTWSADSRMLAFECSENDHSNIWIINADGTNPVNFTGSN